MENRLISLTRAEELKANEAKRLAARGGTPVSVTPTPQPTILGQPVTPISTGRQVTGYTVGTQYKTPIVQSGYEVAAEQQRANDFSVSGNPAALQSPLPAPQPTTTAPSAPTTAVNPLSGKTYTGAAATRLNARLAKQDPIAAEQERIDAIPTTMDEPVFDQETGNLIGSRKVTNPQAVAEKAAAQAALDQKAAAEAQKKQQEKATADRNAMNTAKAQAGTDIAMAQLMMNSPPEAQGYLQAVQAGMNAIGQIPEDMTQEEWEAQNGAAIGRPYDAIQAIMDEHKSFTQSLGQQVQDLMKEGYDKQQKLQAEQQANIEQQLVWQESKLKRDQQEINKQELDRMTISLALRGGFGSVDGNQQIADSRRKGEEALIDLQKEYGFKRTDVALQFTEMTNEAYMNYHSNFLQNIERMETNLTNINMQSVSNQQAKGNAIRSEYKAWKEGVEAHNKELAGMLEKAATFVYGVQQEARAEKQNKEKDAWNRLDWVKTTFGTNAPQSLIESIAKDIPNVNVQEIMDAPTLAEMKEMRLSGGGGTSGGFSSYGTGMEFSTNFGQTPTFEEFISVKEGEQNRSIAPQGREAYRKEYEAMVQQENRYSVAAIEKMFDDKIATNADLAKHSKESAREAVDRAIARGDYQEARRLVEGAGKAPPQKQGEGFQQAIIVRQGISEIDALIEELGTIGPIIGRFREMNPYDNRVVRLKQLTTQVIPGLARGIYKEVGVLTDTDIATYRSTMANPRLTYEQAKTATRDTLRKVQLSLDTTLDAWDAEKLNTRDYRTMAEQQADVSAVSGTPQGSTSEADLAEFVRSQTPR